jgi:hypothetical protein
MQVFVKLSGHSGTKTVEMDAGSRAGALVELACKKFGMSVPMGDLIIKIKCGMESIVPEKELDEGYREKTFEISISRSPVNSGVLEKLNAVLTMVAGETVGNEMIFIGVGSHDNGQYQDSAKHQQCPDQMLEYCMDNQIDLNILLIDGGFAAPSYHRQVYEMPGWVALESDLGGLVRQYKYRPAQERRSCDIWLFVFATKIMEYSSTESLLAQGSTIGGVSLPDKFSVLNKVHNACLICGNFFMEKTPGTQYFTMGDRGMIEGAGFTHNPYPSNTG